MAISKGGGPAAAAISQDVRATLMKFVSELDTAEGAADPGALDAGQVLLDVNIGDIRLLAVRRVHAGPASLLSPREQEIAQMVARGYGNKKIASALDISSWTVASHLRRIFVKLQVSSRTAMVTSLSDAELRPLLTWREGEAGSSARAGNDRCESVERGSPRKGFAG